MDKALIIEPVWSSIAGSYVGQHCSISLPGMLLAVQKKKSPAPRSWQTSGAGGEYASLIK